MIELWASVVFNGLIISCSHLTIRRDNVSTIWVMVELRMTAGDAQHAYYPFICNGYFLSRLNSVNLTVFGLVSSNAVTNTIIYLSPTYHYIMLVITVLSYPWYFRKIASEGSSSITRREQTFFYIPKRMTGNKLGMGKVAAVM